MSSNKKLALKLGKRKKDPLADPKCVMCKGYGYYKTIGNYILNSLKGYIYGFSN